MEALRPLSCPERPLRDVARRRERKQENGDDGAERFTEGACNGWRPSRRINFIKEVTEQVIDIFPEEHQAKHDAREKPFLMMSWRKHNVISACHGLSYLPSMKVSLHTRQHSCRRTTLLNSTLRYRKISPFPKYLIHDSEHK